MFRGCHFPAAVILTCIRWYCPYKLSYRDIEELMAERGVEVDHATVIRWVVKFAPILLYVDGVVVTAEAQEWPDPISAGQEECPWAASLPGQALERRLVGPGQPRRQRKRSG